MLEISKIYTHKITKRKLKCIKVGKTVSKFLVVDEPSVEFWNRTIPNRKICKNENMVLNELEQGVLF